jgi:FemAB-related protein (PEP-CTERM system-associated)
MCHDPRWLGALARGLKQSGFQICARQDGEIVGVLPLTLVKSVLFGRYLVSLPYLNGGGVLVRNGAIANPLIDQAVELARQYSVRFLELRHEGAWSHEGLSGERTDKFHMRLDLPGTVEELWTQLRAKVRNQVRKGEAQCFDVRWGREELLPDFYRVFSHNMRDLGTPVFGCSLFREILAAFTAEAEFCVLRHDRRPVAAALLVHGKEQPTSPAPARCASTTAPTPIC